MSNNLTGRIETCVENDDDEAACQILENHSSEITDDAVLKKVAEVAIGKNPNNVSRFYLNVISRVDSELAGDLTEMLANHANRSELFRVMRHDGAAIHHESILEFFSPETRDDDDNGGLLAEVGDKLSKEHKVRIARAADPVLSPETDQYMTAIGVLGDLLDDDTLVKIVDKMAEK